MYNLNIFTYFFFFFNFLIYNICNTFIVSCNHSSHFIFYTWEISLSYDLVAAIVGPFILSVQRWQGNNAYIDTHIPILLGALHAY